MRMVTAIHLAIHLPGVCFILVSRLKLQRHTRRVPLAVFSCRYSYLVDPASSHMLVSKIKPCMSKYIL